ncbi:MAG TPA: hypothetical protein PK668_22605 [Myxococcota bacterium]|nr:hypothetical protein [Myxococcota bacterium]HRY95485.1 hypothetical protein [Myxococcota bacterium]HSA21743.1 hypothetical protein [Myxococcota bacterium]
MRKLLPCLLLLALGSPARAGDVAVDERGRSLRVAFDPASVVRLGVLGGAEHAGAFEGALELELGVAYRTVEPAGEGAEGVSWTLEHRFAWTRLRPLQPAAGGAPALDATAYAGGFMRHSAEPSLTLPGSPPRRVFFPFDIGVECELGRLQLRPLEEGLERLEVGVARAGVALDPWRAGRPGNDLRLVLGVRYDVELTGQPGLADAQARHRLAPFTAAWARFRWQDEPGLTALEVLADAFPHWSPGPGWDVGAEARARVERVLVALDDQPLALVAEAGWTHRPAGPGGREAEEEVRLLLGLALSFQLRGPR